MLDLFVMFAVWYLIGFVSLMIGTAIENVEHGHRFDRLTPEIMVDIFVHSIFGAINIFVVLVYAIEVVSTQSKASKAEFYVFGKPNKKEPE